MNTNNIKTNRASPQLHTSPFLPARQPLITKAMMVTMRARSWIWLSAILFSQTILFARLAPVVHGSSSTTSSSGTKAAFLSKPLTRGGATRPPQSSEEQTRNGGLQSLSILSAKSNHNSTDDEMIYVRKSDGSMEPLQESKVS